MPDLSGVDAVLALSAGAGFANHRLGADAALSLTANMAFAGYSLAGVDAGMAVSVAADFELLPSIVLNGLAPSGFYADFTDHIEAELAAVAPLGAESAFTIPVVLESGFYLAGEELAEATSLSSLYALDPKPGGAWLEGLAAYDCLSVSASLFSPGAQWAYLDAVVPYAAATWNNRSGPVFSIAADFSTPSRSAILAATLVPAMDSAFSIPLVGASGFYLAGEELSQAASLSSLYALPPVPGQAWVDGLAAHDRLAVAASLFSSGVQWAYLDAGAAASFSTWSNRTGLALSLAADFATPSRSAELAAGWPQGDGGFYGQFGGQVAAAVPLAESVFIVRQSSVFIAAKAAFENTVRYAVLAATAPRMETDAFADHIKGTLESLAPPIVIGGFSRFLSGELGAYGPRAEATFTHAIGAEFSGALPLPEFAGFGPGINLLEVFRGPRAAANFAGFAATAARFEARGTKPVAAFTAKTGRTCRFAATFPVPTGSFSGRATVRAKLAALVKPAVSSLFGFAAPAASLFATQPGLAASFTAFAASTARLAGTSASLAGGFSGGADIGLAGLVPAAGGEFAGCTACSFFVVLPSAASSFQASPALLATFAAPFPQPASAFGIANVAAASLDTASPFPASAFTAETPLPAWLEGMAPGMAMAMVSVRSVVARLAPLSHLACGAWFAGCSGLSGSFAGALPSMDGEWLAGQGGAASLDTEALRPQGWFLGTQTCQ